MKSFSRRAIAALSLTALIGCGWASSHAQNSSSSSVDAVRAANSKIAASNPQLNAFLSFNPDALAQARSIDDAPGGKPLRGTVVAVKDNISVNNLPFTFGSVLFENNRGIRDAIVVRRLKAAGTVVIGKTNLDEFAGDIWGISGKGGQTVNVFSSDRIPAGSSAGSAVAVGSGMVDFALGTDTCASIMLPSSAAGVFGMRPSYNLVPLDGVLPGYPDHDVVGPISRNLLQLAKVLDIMSAQDRFAKAVQTGKQGPIKIAILDPSLRRSSTNQATSAFDARVSQLRQAGFQIVQINPNISNLIDNIGNTLLDGDAIVKTAEFLKIFPNSPITRPSDFGLQENYSKILGPPKGPRAYFREVSSLGTENDAKIQEHRELLASLRQRLQQAINAVDADVILVPTAEAPPPRISATSIPDNYADYCDLTAWSGLPAISIPSGKFAGTNFPYAVMAIARFDQDDRLLAVADRIHRVTQ
jgi:amidase